MKKLQSWQKLKLKILIFLLSGLLVFNIYPGIKSALSLSLWIPGSFSYILVPFNYQGFTYYKALQPLLYKTDFAGQVSIYSPSSRWWQPLSLYASLRGNTPWVLNYLRMKIIGGSPVNIPEAIYLTRWASLYTYTGSISFGAERGIPTAYLSGVCGPGCYTIGSVIDSEAIFSGWEPIPPEAIVEYFLAGNARASLYNLNDQVFLNLSANYSRTSDKLVLTDYLKKIFIAGGASGNTGAAYFQVLPAQAFQNLAIYLDGQKVYEKPGLVTGVHSVDLTEALKEIFVSQSLTKGYVDIPLGIEIEDGAGQKIEPFTFNLEISGKNIQNQLKISHHQSSINLKVVDSEKGEVIAQKFGTSETGFEIPPENLSPRVNIELEDQDNKTKVILKKVDLENVSVEGCDFSITEDLITPTKKSIKIEVTEECQKGSEKEISFNFGELRIIPEKLTLRKCENDVCQTLSREVDSFQKRVIIRIPAGESLSEFILEEDELKALCPYPIKSKILRRGFRNKEVRLIQKFLSLDNSIYPEGLITGYFGPLTEKAINRFQLKYKEEILGPWNLTEPTGIAGKYTIKKINQLICQ